MQEQQDSTQNEKFLDAIERGDIAAVKVFLADKSFDPAANNQHAIFLANQTIQNKNNGILKLLLLNKRANPNPNSLFLSAVIHGHTATVKLLLDYSKVDLKTYENRAIELAAKNGHNQILVLFNSNRVFSWAIKNRDDKVAKLMIDYKSLDLQSAIILVAEYGDLVALESLLAKKQIYFSEAGGASAINIAALNGHYEIVEMFLRDGRVSPYSAIENAVKGKHHKIVRLLLRDQRVANYKHIDKSVFLFLIKKNDVVSLTLLLKNGCIGNSSKVYALAEACGREAFGPIMVLLEYGCIDIDEKKKIFLKACEYKNKLILDIFLDYGKIDEHTVNQGFQNACEHGHTEIVKMFLSKDLKVDHNKGFLEACTHGNADVVSLLLVHPKPKDLFSGVKLFFNPEIEMAIDLTADNNAVIKKVAELGHVEVMKVLLKDPRISLEVKDEAMRIASIHKPPKAAAVVALDRYGFFGHGNSAVLPDDITMTIKKFAVDLTLEEPKSKITSEKM